MKYVILTLAAIFLVGWTCFSCEWIAAQEKQKGDPKIEVAVKVAQARLEIVKADAELSAIELEHASSQIDRYDRLLRGRAVSPEDYGHIRQRYRNAKANHARNKARILEAEALVEYARVHGIADTSLTFPREPQK
jgi:multidrug resistance efflux pump